jgi:hypothetical protein
MLHKLFTIGLHNMITEYTDTFLNPLPVSLWYIIVNTTNNTVIEDLSIQQTGGCGMLLAANVKYITFSTKAEGKEYMQDNSLQSIEDFENVKIEKEIKERDNE